MKLSMDLLPTVLFSIEDTERFCTYANMALIYRLGLARHDDIVGRKVTELYTEELGGLDFEQQNRRVLRGESIENILEIRNFSNGTHSWCVTHKWPLYESGSVHGILDISRDLGEADKQCSTYKRLQLAVVYLRTHYKEKIRVKNLALLVGASVAQLERDFKRVLQCSPMQMVINLRIGAAMKLLYGRDTVATVSQACGFSDQSAFAQQFKSTVGMTPSKYRALAQDGLTTYQDPAASITMPDPSGMREGPRGVS